VNRPHLLANTIRSATPAQRSFPSPWVVAFWTFFLLAGGWIAAQLAALILADWRAAGLI
jgi:hypothetical protein